MILVLDDTFTYQSRKTKSCLNQNKYESICKIFQKPTVADFRHLLKYKDDYNLLCKHRSLQLFNKKGNEIEGNEIIENFCSKFSNKKMLSVEFGSDMLTNLDSATINKNLFYTNIEKLLNNYIATGNIEIKILYFGESYRQKERMTIVDKAIDETYCNSIPDLKENSIFVEALKLLLNDKAPDLVIDNWIKLEVDKPSIRKFLNDKL